MNSNEQQNNLRLRKAELLLKAEKKKLSLQYSENIWCEFIDILNTDELTPYYHFFNEVTKIDNQEFKSRLNINETTKKENIKDWIVCRIEDLTKDNDVIILVIDGLGAKIRLKKSKPFFKNQLQKNIEKFIGLDLGYINETNKFYHYFSDDEYFVSEYFSKF